MTRISIAFCTILAIGLVAGIPQGRGGNGNGNGNGRGPEHKGPPEFVKKCAEETGFDHRDRTEEVTEAEACFSECLKNNKPKKHNLEELKKKCDETGDCKKYEHVQEFEECVKTAEATTEKCAEGSKYAQCFRKLHKNHGPPHGGPPRGGPPRGGPPNGGPPNGGPPRGGPPNGGPPNGGPRD